MKIIFTVVLISALSISAFAKKVKFSVDMDTIAITVNGIHITGDFQDEAGFAADWDPATTAMTQEVSDPSIYSIVVDIPAFRHYEFKFVNGIFGYEVEFVPQPSRVGYQFNDNRWIYIDSLANDTQLVKPVIYSTNAPAGKHLLRFRVDLRNIPTIDPKGVHVAGNFQGWDTSATYMHTFDGDIHEYIAYVDTGNSIFEHEYKFFNGESSGTEESVPLACANLNANRGVFISKDTILEAVCFSQCSSCVGNAISENEDVSFVSIFPNPSSGAFTVSGLQSVVNTIEVYDSVGQIVYKQTTSSKHSLISLSVAKGIYFLRTESKGQIASSKLVIE